MTCPKSHSPDLISSGLPSSVRLPEQSKHHVFYLRESSAFLAEGPPVEGVTWGSMLGRIIITVPVL